MSDREPARKSTKADRAIAERIHAIIRVTVPELAPKLWYGMPACAKDGAAVCFLQGAQKFKTRYSTIGFTDKAALDDGPIRGPPRIRLEPARDSLYYSG